MGGKDDFAFNDTIKHLETIKENTKTKNSVVKIIENCGHTFRNKEKELAQVILDFVK